MQGSGGVFVLLYDEFWIFIVNVSEDLHVIGSGSAVDWVVLGVRAGYVVFVNEI